LKVNTVTGTVTHMPNFVISLQTVSELQPCITAITDNGRGYKPALVCLSLSRLTVVVTTLVSRHLNTVFSLSWSQDPMSWTWSCIYYLGPIIDDCQTKLSAPNVSD